MGDQKRTFQLLKPHVCNESSLVSSYFYLKNLLPTIYIYISCFQPLTTHPHPFLPKNFRFPGSPPGLVDAIDYEWAMQLVQHSCILTENLRGNESFGPGFLLESFLCRKSFEDFSAFKGLIEDDFLKRDASCIWKDLLVHDFQILQSWLHGKFILKETCFVASSVRSMGNPTNFELLIFKKKTYHPCMVYLPTFGWFLW